MQENERELQGTEDAAERFSDNLKTSLEESPTAEPKTSEEQPNHEIPQSRAFRGFHDLENAPAANTPTKDDTQTVLEEIERSNAEDAEDTDNEKRHHIPMLDYHSMSLENLVGELQRLVKNEKIQAINKHVNSIKYEFDQKFQVFLEHKKEEFMAHGGNEVDFRYNSVAKRQFNEVHTEYREKRDRYYKQLNQNLKNNLQKRLEIIEELKALVNVEENINTTYKNFKELQERWHNAGSVPRHHYNDIWCTYHHHMEIFYDFLHLNRELRDLDFKHNLEEKLKLVERAEALPSEPDLGKAFHELQTLHKIWKEDIGPIDKEQRKEVWERFSNATKALHEKRQEQFRELEKVYKKNLVRKQEIISSISEIADNTMDNHRALQKQMNQVEELRQSFFKAGKVPLKVNEQTWSAFKEVVRRFNRNKNAFYRNQKKEQHQNLEKKRALLDLALSLKDSDDWKTVTPEMKRIQGEWKKIGHVPRKHSDEIWNKFKNACNHYFDRLHSEKNSAPSEEQKNLEDKNAVLKRLKAFQLSGQKEKDISALKEFIAEWKNYGRVPYNKKHVNTKFNKIVYALFKKTGVSAQESELIKYGDKMQQLAKADDDGAIQNERTFIRRKIDESHTEIRQLENNLQFFSNASGNNPLVKEVVKNIAQHKKALETWKAKLKRLNIMENNRNKDIDGDTLPKSEKE